MFVIEITNADGDHGWLRQTSGGLIRRWVPTLIEATQFATQEEADAVASSLNPNLDGAVVRLMET